MPKRQGIPEKLASQRLGVFHRRPSGHPQKWLNHREQELLGRPPKEEETRGVTAMACRLAAIVLLQPKLDENYRAVAASMYSWPKTE